jgi:uncharacterized protein
MADAILKCGGTIALPKFAVTWVCRRGYFLDPEGNTFGIFQPDPMGLNRSALSVFDAHGKDG